MGKVAIELDGVKKTFRGLFGKQRVILERAFLSIPIGAAVGLVGENGVGKTTILHLVLGFLFPDEGRVSVFGRSPRAFPPHSGLRWLPDRPPHFRGLTGRQYLDFLHHAYGLKEKGARTQETTRLLKQYGLTEAADLSANRYSRGMQQRLGLAALHVGDPRLVVLDEPTHGLDFEGLTLFRRTVQELQERECTLLIASHDLMEIERIGCSTIGIAAGDLVKGSDRHKVSARQAVAVRCSDSVAAIRLGEFLKKRDFDIRLENNEILLDVGSDGEKAEIVHILAERMIGIHSVIFDDQGRIAGDK